METRRRELLALEAQYRRDKNFVVKEVNHKLVRVVSVMKAVRV